MNTQLAFEWPGTEDALDPINDREQIRQLEVLTYDCGVKTAHHVPHQRTDGAGECPGLQTKLCDDTSDHPWHRWATPTRFYWCQPYDRITGTIRTTV